MTTTEQPTYSFDYAGNSYFNGRDALITRNDGKSIRINVKDGCMAVYVKDHGLAFSDLPDDVRAMADELVAMKPEEETEWGGDYSSVLYERAREVWWSDAEWLAVEDPDGPQYDSVYSDGRSGGWCCIKGTGLEEGFPTRDIEDALAQPPADLSAEDIIEEYKARDKFLELAFNLVANIHHVRTEILGDMVREEYAELEANRERAIVRGEN